jgi:hypothetical protein
MAGSLSMYITVALDWPNPKSSNTDRKFLAVLAAETAARNSVSVERVAAIDCVLERYATAALEKQKT